ncbi:unnamed protein product [Pedinophyceae sp. YPF-701]|nr:unnamed protein product [Pedinophyceae sp. YPF-701]
MLWVDKYRPDAFERFAINQDIGKRLQGLAGSGDCPHVLLYGPPGAGKKTIVLSLLRELYGAGAKKVKVEHRPWKIELPSRKLELELTMVTSNYHVEMNPSDVGNNDRYVVQEIIKEMAKSRPVDPSGAKTFKVLVLNEVDRLSREAQHSLRRTMEKYSSACRLVLICTNVSKVLDPLRSRCVCVRVPAPSLDEIQGVLQEVAKREQTTLPPPLAARIALASERNLRKALLSLESCRVQAGTGALPENMDVQLADWELYIKTIATDIVSEQSPKQVYTVRGKLYELLSNVIPPELIARRLVMELCRKIPDDALKPVVVEAGATFEHRMQGGSKPIFHLEAFVARVMSEYKKWAMDALGG